MFEEIKIKGTNPTDKVFKCDGYLVKVRLLKKEIVPANKILGPTALSLHLSASICNRRGKAIPRDGGRYCVLPHTITLPVISPDPERRGLKNELENILKPLILQTVNWHKNLKVLDEVISGWERPAAKRRTKTKA